MTVSEFEIAASLLWLLTKNLGDGPAVKMALATLLRTARECDHWVSAK
jgi:hypothetical protein